MARRYRFVHLKMALFARANANAALLTNNCYLSKLTSYDVMLRSLARYTTLFTTGQTVSKCVCNVNTLVYNNLTSNLQNNFIRRCHVAPHNKNYVPFEEVLSHRRQEANRSILVQVQSLNSSDELYTYCNEFGSINGMHHYCIKDNMHFYLVEFTDILSAKAALESATHINYDEVIPVQSPMLWFRTSRGAKKKQNLSPNLESFSVTQNGSQIPTNSEITECLLSTTSMSEQMVLLHNAWKLDEVGIRLRFLTAHQLERSFVGLFPNIEVFPFGSSVNGFGKRGCDLDLVLSLEKDKIEKPTSRFVFHTKSIPNDSRAHSRRLMETIADSLQHFVPGVTNVRRILQARVPIIKYDQSLTGLECDLSMTNMAAVYMSELLCFYGEIDWRVRPLVFTIRQWAKSIGLTNTTPGRWITNFSITLLVLFYLQHKRILPTLNSLKSLAGEDDIRLTDHSVDCTFLRDVKKLPLDPRNVNEALDLQYLLQGFFEFYSSFDFPAKAISLREGTSIFKPDYSPLYICNPLEPMLNVSKNVSIEETERLKLALRNASWTMETINDPKTRKRGILSLFDQKLDIVSFVAGKRVVNLAALFKIPKDAKKPSSSELHPVAKSVARNAEGVARSAEAQASRNTRMKKSRARRR